MRRREGQKKSDKQNNNTQTIIVLITAILNLIKVLIDLINRLLE